MGGILPPPRFGCGHRYARVRVNPAGGAQLALTETANGYAYGISYDGDSVRFHLDDFKGTRDSYGARVWTNGQNAAISGDFGFVNYTWYDVRLSWTPDRKTFTFEHKDTTTDEYTLGFQHTMAEPLTLNYVGLSLAVYSSGNGAQWVGYTFEPEEISFTDMQLQDTAAMEFLSAMGKPYRLEYTTDLVSSSTWHGAGASLTGTGTNMYFFDPQEAAGSSVSKAYRIVSP